MLQVQSITAGLLVILFAGCGSASREIDPIFPVTGTVTLSGAPLGDIRIVFENKELAISTMVDVDSEGKYTVLTADGKGLPVGSYVVYLMPPHVEVPLGPIPPDLMKKINDVSFPSKYRDSKTSGLTASIVAADQPQVIDFDLTP